MVIKLFGAALVIFGTLFAVTHFFERIELALKNTSALRSLLECTKNMIECYAMPAGEILSGLDGSLLKNCGYCFDVSPASFFELVENCNIYDGEAKDLMLAFAKDFGKSYRADEVARCSSYLEKMRSREQKLYKESQKRKKLIVTVALCTALAVIILLI